MENKDIKYLGVPNVCFSLTSKDDEREEQFKQQRIERGFDDSETWSLRDTIANFIIPRLERYQEIANKMLIRDEKLVKDIDIFLVAMKLIIRDEGAAIYTKKESKLVKKGLKKLHKIFVSLWW